MPPTPVEIPRFQGLDLRTDPQEVGLGGAVDALDADLDRPGRLRQRDGYAKFTTVAGAAAYGDLAPYYRASVATAHLVAARGRSVDALNTSGGVIATYSSDVSVTNWSLVRIGLSTSDLMYAIPFPQGGWVGSGYAGANWNGTAWTPSLAPNAMGACLQEPDNRLVIIDASGNSKVSFSDAGTPESWGAGPGVAANYVQLTPGDGEFVAKLVSWNRLVFAFKQTKIFVFYGNGISSTGTPVFNYRPIAGGVGCVGPRAAVATPNGVVFLDRTGLWLTTGSGVRLISEALNPLFGKGALPATYTGSAINWAQIYNASVSYFNQRVYLSVPTGASTTNDRTFVLDLATDQWMPWSLKLNTATSFRVSSEEEMVFSLSSGTNDVCRFGPSYTADAGATISSKYRTGFWNPGAPGAESWVRECLLTGSGSVTVKTAVNDNATLGSGQAVTLGTAPVIAQGRDRRGLRGRNVSYEFSGTSAWALSSAVPILWSQRSPGLSAG